MQIGKALRKFSARIVSTATRPDIGAGETGGEFSENECGIGGLVNRVAKACGIRAGRQPVGRECYEG